ncbi:CHAT domain-containing protein [Novosphingobium tardum]|uniref:CHAT domain-containing protein n=1 Tax=Novosphingobium tardum TaxID=1538021 RepID=A0ABV8RPC9_9SPHN
MRIAFDRHAARLAARRLVRAGIVRSGLSGLAAALALAIAPDAAAQELPLSIRDSFPLGSGGNALCQVQSRVTDAAIVSPLDRAWAVVCRDSALPVGYVFALRGANGPAALSQLDSRLASRRGDKADCGGARKVEASLIQGGEELACEWRDPQLGYSVAHVTRGKTVWFVEGFTAYKSALALAVRSLMADKLLPGEIMVATTSLGDSEAYARIQALTLDPQTALAEGYHRNNSGDYADAAAYFETLEQRQAGKDDQPIDRGEFLINAALQRSNLSQFSEADRLFAEAAALPAGNAVIERLRRNYEAIHLLNQGRYREAVARLAQPLRVQSALGSDILRERLEVTPQLARRVNASDAAGSALGLTDDLKLSPEERALILDAQAEALKGSAQRLMGDPVSARASLLDALSRAVAVRNGRVVSIVRLRAQILTDVATIDEAAGDFAAAEQELRSAAQIVAVRYPETRSLAAIQARLGAFLVRRGRTDEALAIYREVIARSFDRRDALSGLSNQMNPYFDLLVGRMATDPKASAEFFAASQILVRPGVAETQAVLSRELSGGSDDASRLFRQSVSLTRSIERSRMQYAAISGLADAAARADELAALDGQIKTLEAQQQATIVGLSAFPRYRAVAQHGLTEAELQQGLRANEAYAKVAVLGQSVYVYTATPTHATGYRANLSANEMERLVMQLRDSISRYDGEQYVTEPFKVGLARQLYVALLGPANADLLAAHHIVFEPDGAMLKLPINLLVVNDDSVARYDAANKKPNADAFDDTMVDWLGKDRIVSTAVSARSFIDARNLPPSSAKEAYLGLGKNATINGSGGSLGVRSVRGDQNLGCDWPLAAWNNPISDAELIEARSLVGPQGSDLMVGRAFSDTAIKARTDLDQFRILHFATHGLVTPPSPDCPTRPALLTSFGSEKSDGLLTFSEIFDLHLDADMVILSACDTAGEADVVTTRAAGIASGGGSALDGLVRSFIGAGGRAVLASHWPAPDDFDATGRLITGLFSAGPGVATGDALLAAQQQLMRDPQTSHPYYWAGFAVIGDGARPLLRPSAPMTTAAMSKSVHATLASAAHQ